MEKKFTKKPVLILKGLQKAENMISSSSKRMNVDISERNIKNGFLSFLYLFKTLINLII